MSQILLTGGSGRLGTELQNHISCYAPASDVLDITKPIILKAKDYSLVIHCAGYTNVAKAEKEPAECYRINFWGTDNLASHFDGIPFVNISTEYVYNPVNVYSWSKCAQEGALRHPYLNIRTTFKPRPYPYNRAWTDQYITGDYVDVIAVMILTAIDNWDKRTSKTIDVGTGRKTVYDLARMTKPDIEEAKLYECELPVELPADYLSDREDWK